MQYLLTCFVLCNQARKLYELKTAFSGVIDSLRMNLETIMNMIYLSYKNTRESKKRESQKIGGIWGDFSL